MSSLWKFCVGIGGGDDNNDPALWSNSLQRHFLGKFSMAVLQSNQPVEDHSQVETFRNATFIGVYDGHVDDVASQYVSEHFFPNLLKYMKDNPEESVSEALRHAYLATDEAFLREVERTRGERPRMCATGTCCLVGFIQKGKVYVANAGDSKAALGCLADSTAARNAGIVATQLSEDHNASIAAVRNQLIEQHPHDPNIVIHKNGAWRVKGIIQVTRTIGSAFLKMPGYELPPEDTRFQLPESPLPRAALTAEPTITEHTIGETDRFLIFASDGLWDHLSINEAVDMVFRGPRKGIASRLIRTARRIAATKAGSSINAVKRTPRGRGRRAIHDDITAVVVFIDPRRVESVPGPEASIVGASFRGCNQSVVPSAFRTMYEDAEGR